MFSLLLFLNSNSHSFQIESQPDGIRILHILGVEYRHSGEIKCSAFIEDTRDHSVSQFTDLVVLPSAENTDISSLLAATAVSALSASAAPVAAVITASSPSEHTIQSRTSSETNTEYQNLPDEIDIPAYFTRGLNDCTILIGDNVKLEVFFCGYPEPQVKWLRAVNIIFLIHISFLSLHYAFYVYICFL